jgi:hypothetical protein
MKNAHGGTLREEPTVEMYTWSRPSNAPQSLNLPQKSPDTNETVIYNREVSLVKFVADSDIAHVHNNIK